MEVSEAEGMSRLYLQPVDVISKKHSYSGQVGLPHVIPAAPARSVGAGTYTALSSLPLGHSTYREQYVFLYRPARICLLDAFTYPDLAPGRPDVFACEPHIVRLHLPSRGCDITTGIEDMWNGKTEIKVDNRDQGKMN
ncbi:hypothetical protein Y1Q_0021011 [Alligator mississippiensis]|uniref:Uncharacterized protein n=1 Tax=Alligator mississippiensis TaxID=8496 RepID=A0A151NC91_ALLMI|nr:hypothetical protein Y1Q_0021011 [Alligator mississippiensis]